jgi:hypothetical protein
MKCVQDNSLGLINQAFFGAGQDIQEGNNLAFIAAEELGKRFG